MDLEARYFTALSIADEAAELALSWFERRHLLTVERKGLQDLVSEADREVEALIRRRLAERFPEDLLIGEELGAGEGPADARWVIDPIDGTTNFLRGLPHWAIVIAFCSGEQVEHGVIVAPALRERYLAQRGRGAQCNARPLRVSATATLADAVIAAGSNKKLPQKPYLDALGGLLASGAEYRRLGSAALNLASVAAGRLDAYYEASLSPWDTLAGLLMVREAGGRVNGYFDGASPQAPGPVFASNAALADALSAHYRVSLAP